MGSRRRAGLPADRHAQEGCSPKAPTPSESARAALASSVHDRYLSCATALALARFALGANFDAGVANATR